MFTGDAQGFLAGGQDAQLWGRLQQLLCQSGDLLDDVLAVVQDQQSRLVAQGPHQAVRQRRLPSGTGAGGRVVPHAEDRRNDLVHVRGRGPVGPVTDNARRGGLQSGELRQAHPAGEALRRLRRGGQGELGLADPARTGQRDRACSTPAGSAARRWLRHVRSGRSGPWARWSGGRAALGRAWERPSARGPASGSPGAERRVRGRGPRPGSPEVFAQLGVAGQSGTLTAGQIQRPHLRGAEPLPQRVQRPRGRSTRRPGGRVRPTPGALRPVPPAAVRRCSSSLVVAVRVKSSSAKSAKAGPRHRASASARRAARERGSCVLRALPVSSWKRPASTASGAVRNS